MLQHFLRTYETYSFRMVVGLGLCHTNHILQRALERAEDGVIPEEELARIIAGYNRKVFANEEVQDEMYREISQAEGG